MTTAQQQPAPAPTVRFRYVDVNPTRQTVLAVHTHPDGTDYVVQHLPNDGWWCRCPRGRRCPAIPEVQAHIPGISPPDKKATTTT